MWIKGPQRKQALYILNNPESDPLPLVQTVLESGMENSKSNFQIQLTVRKYWSTVQIFLTILLGGGGGDTLVPGGTYSRWRA